MLRGPEVHQVSGSFDFPASMPARRGRGLAALQASRELQTELAAIVDRLERLATAREPHGHESWPER